MIRVDFNRNGMWRNISYRARGYDKMADEYISSPLGSRVLSCCDVFKIKTKPDFENESTHSF
jgi:hypothetical protein